MTDAQLLQLLDRKPDEALQALSARYGTLASAIAGRILPDHRQDTEEIAADVLIRIWEKRHTLDPQTLRGFVITTARNLAIDRWRTLRRRREVPLFDDDREATEFLETQVLTQVLAEQIRDMSPPDGEIFLRHHLLLETAAQIAQRFELTEGAVRARLHRMRKQLRKEIPHG